MKDIPKDVDGLREYIKKRSVEVISQKLSDKEIDNNRAKEIAKHVLDSLSGDFTYDTLMSLIPKLDDDYKELTVVIFPVVLEYQRKISEETKNTVSHLLKNKRFGDALRLINKSLEYEKHLSE